MKDLFNYKLGIFHANLLTHVHTVVLEYHPLSHCRMYLKNEDITFKKSPDCDNLSHLKIFLL